MAASVLAYRPQQVACLPHMGSGPSDTDTTQIGTEGGTWLLNIFS